MFDPIRLLMFLLFAQLFGFSMTLIVTALPGGTMPFFELWGRWTLGCFGCSLIIGGMVELIAEITGDF